MLQLIIFIWRLSFVSIFLEKVINLILKSFLFVMPYIPPE